MRYLLSIDPGKSTGITLWSVPEDAPAERTHAWQVEGGLSGFLEWAGGHDWAWMSSFVLAEKFTPIQNKGFALTLEAVEPLRIEGAMVALGIIPDYEAGSDHWQRPSEMYVYGGSNPAEKKKRAVEFGKKHGLHLTGKGVGCKDANDALSSTWHALAWLRGNHGPSLRHYWKEPK